MIGVADYLRDKGIQPSIQRVMIAKYLFEHRDHPSADDVFNNLHITVPTLSKATVYNTLNLFYNHNIVNIIITEDGERHFDGFTEPHAHTVCPICGKIEDITLNDKERKVLDNIASKTGAEGATISMRKCCDKCRKTN